MQELITRHLDLWTSAAQTKSTTGRNNRGKIDTYGINKLRELILHFAVRGLLTEQDPKEDATPAFLESTKEIRALIESGLVKEIKNIEALHADTYPFKAPKGWLFVRLGSLLKSIKSGGTPSKQNPEFWDGDIPWASVKDLGFGEPLTKTQDTITVAGLHSGSTLANKGSVLICTRMGLGKIGEVHIDTAINQDLKAVTLSSAIQNNFFITFFKTISIIGTGTTVSGIKQEELVNFVVPLPPISEQKRIVEKVDELMTLCDQLEQQQTTSLEAHQTLVATLLETLTRAESAADFQQAWQRISTHFDTLFTTEHSIDQLKQTILQLAFMGKLVPQDPSDVPANVLISTLATKTPSTATRGLKGSSHESATEVTNSPPYQLPRGWTWAKLPEVGELARGKSKHRPRNDPALYTGGTVPLIQTGDVSRANPLITTYTAMYNETGIKQSRIWPKGTMCITIAANIADTGILGFDACFPDSVVGFIPFDEKIEVHYFEYFMRTAKSHLEDFAPSTAQKNINLDILSQLLIPLPPVREITRIVDRIDNLMAVCKELAACLAEARATQVLLADAIVDEAAA